MTKAQIWIGFDPREAAAYAVAWATMLEAVPISWPVRGLALDELRRAGLYRRPTEIRDGRLWDTISGAPMSTEFAISRFLVPAMAEPRTGWAMFLDCDMLIRCRRGVLEELVAGLDPRKALYCVKHDHRPTAAVKMDNQAQTTYPRKNWSSVMIFNLDHPANRTLTVDLVNTVPGRDLHRFCWLLDEEIGELPVAFNWLAGHSPAEVDPAIVHFTDGIPAMPGYESAPYADEWRQALTGFGGATVVYWREHNGAS